MMKLSLSSRAARLTAALLVVIALLGVWAVVQLRRRVSEALATPPANRRALGFTRLAAPEVLPPRWGGGDVVGVANGPQGLLVAGARGVQSEAGRAESWALPTLRVSAFALWRGRPVAALQAGGLYRRDDQGWEELRSGWGRLEVRALHETAAGELLIGARQGLFRAAWAATTLERLDTHPVRALAAGSGFILIGGEEGLWRVEPGGAQALATPDPWIESVALAGDRLWVVSAAGLASAAPGGALTPLAGADDIVSGLAQGDGFVGLAEPPALSLRRFTALGRTTEEPLPAPTRRLLEAQGELFADTHDGLYQRQPTGWRLVRAAGDALPTASAHVGALAVFDGQLAVGLFDGGLALAQPRATTTPGENEDGTPLEWRVAPGSDAWGVNALLPAGGLLYVASLRGAARFDGRALHALPGPGAAFALASTPNGVAIGYGQGVWVPDVGLLSAFHGLPANQALALLARPGTPARLFVGTPSGLGALEARRVRFAVLAGEGRLPHPWVTALAQAGDDELFVGTYGGGIVKRLPPRGTSRAEAAGRFLPFVETEGLKINTGCLLALDGRVWAGSDGRGLWRLSRDGARFERVDVALPSPRVTALVAHQGALWVGTDEGLTRIALGSDGPGGGTAD